MEAGGRRGKQIQVLTDGTYYINRLFATVEYRPKTVVPIGFVGVVVSFFGAEGVDTTGIDYKHDGFSYYQSLLRGVLPIELKEITTQDGDVVKRFLKASIGWIRYKPLLIFITNHGRTSEIKNLFIL